MNGLNIHVKPQQSQSSQQSIHQLQQTYFKQLKEHKKTQIFYDQQVKQYQEYFKDIEAETEEFHINFNDIIVSEDNKQQNIKIISIKQTPHSQIVTIELKVGRYISKVRILNINSKSIFHQCQIVGFGAFANVYRIQTVPGSHVHLQNYAIKCCKINIKSHPLKLISILKQFIMFRIANSIGNKCSPLQINPFCFDVYYFSDCVEFVMDFCSWNKSARSTFEKDLKISLRLMHKLNMVHCDIKLPNISYNYQTNKWVFLDFGLSTIIKQRQNQKTRTTFFGTLDHCSPQMCLLSRNNKETGLVNLYYNDLYGLKTSIKQFHQQVQKQTDEADLSYGTRSNDQAQIILNEIVLFLNINRLKLIIYGQYQAMYAELLSLVKQFTFTMKLEVAYFMYEVPLTVKLQTLFNSLGPEITEINQFSDLKLYFGKGLQICEQTHINQVKKQQLQNRYQHLKRLKQLFISQQYNSSTITTLLTNIQQINSLQPQTYYSHLISYLDFNHNIYQTTIHEKIKVCAYFENSYLKQIKMPKDITAVKRTITFMLDYCLNKPYNQWKCKHLSSVFITMVLLNIMTTQTLIKIFILIPQMSQNILYCLTVFYKIKQNLTWIRNFLNAGQYEMNPIQNLVNKTQDALIKRFKAKHKLITSIAQLQQKSGILSYLIQNIYFLCKSKNCINATNIQIFKQLIDPNYSRYLNSFDAHKVQNDYWFETLVFLHNHSLLSFITYGSSPKNIKQLKQRLYALQKGKIRFEYYHFTLMDYYIKMNNLQEVESMMQIMVGRIKDESISSKCLIYSRIKIKKDYFKKQDALFLTNQLGKDVKTIYLAIHQIVNILKSCRVPGSCCDLLQHQAELYTTSIYNFNYQQVSQSITSKLQQSHSNIQNYIQNIYPLYQLLMADLKIIYENNKSVIFILYDKYAGARIIPFNYRIKYLSMAKHIVQNNQSLYQQQFNSIIDKKNTLQDAVESKLLLFNQLSEQSTHILQYFQIKMLNQIYYGCPICKERTILLIVIHDNITILLELISQSIKHIMRRRLTFFNITLQIQDFDRLGGEVMFSYMQFLSYFCCYLKLSKHQLYLKQMTHFYKLIQQTGQFQFLRLFKNKCHFKEHSVISQLILINLNDTAINDDLKKQRIQQLFSHYYQIMANKNKNLLIIHLHQIIKYIYIHASIQQSARLLEWSIQFSAINSTFYRGKQQNLTEKCMFLMVLVFQHINNGPVRHRLLMKINKQMQQLCYKQRVNFIGFYFFSILYDRKQILNKTLLKNDRWTIKLFIKALIANERGDGLLCSYNLNQQIYCFHYVYYKTLIKGMNRFPFKNKLLQKVKKAMIKYNMEDPSIFSKIKHNSNQQDWHMFKNTNLQQLE